MKLILQVFTQNLFLFYTFMIVLSLMIGSFLNVIIYRFPIMLQQSWREQCLDFLGMPSEEKPQNFNLSLPSSHCPECKHSLRWYENIPLLSYLFLRGRCAYCKVKISFRYSLVELITLLLSIVIIQAYGMSIETLLGLVFTWFLIPMVMIDIDHQILPDQMTLLFMWIGLLVSVIPVWVSPQDAILGACAGDRKSTRLNSSHRL